MPRIPALPLDFDVLSVLVRLFVVFVEENLTLLLVLLLIGELLPVVLLYVDCLIGVVLGF